MLYNERSEKMKESIDYQFSKHYGRLIEDLKQIKGFTPVMEKVISINISKLHEDIENEITKGDEYAVSEQYQNNHR